MENVSRQVRRQNARRMGKLAPSSTPRTSMRWVGRTKGKPYSTFKLLSVAPSKSGQPARMTLKSPRSGIKHMDVTPENLRTFFMGFEPEYERHLLGMY